MDEQMSPLNRGDFLNLYQHYGDILQKELESFYKYFNFYIGLLSAILAATISGLVGFDEPSGDIRVLVLLVGPALVFILGSFGGPAVETFYRRFVEAWVTYLNIESMLGLHDSGRVSPEVHLPPYPSKYPFAFFIPQIEYKNIKNIFDDAREKPTDAETLVAELVESGTTLSAARRTFWAFRIAGIVVAGFIILVYFV